MKLQKICNRMHHNALKEPGTLIECIRKVPGFEIGDVNEVIKDKSNEYCFVTKDWYIYAIGAFKKHQPGLDQ